MPTKIYLRRGLDSELQAVVLESGEPGWTTDQKKLYIGDGTTSGGIFVGGYGIGVDTLNALIGDVTISGGAGIIVTISGQTVVVSETSGGLDVDSLNGLTGVVNLVGGSGIALTISGQYIVIDEESGGDDVDSLNGLKGDVTISGAGVVTVTEDGQNIVVSGEDITDVDSINGLQNAVTISGAGITEVTEDGQKIVITSTETDDVDSLNALIGDVTISGTGVVTVSEDGQKIVVSGEDVVDVDSINALTGAVTVSGAGVVTVSEDGQNIVVSGEDVIDVDSVNTLQGDVVISGAGTVHVSEDGQIIVISGQDRPVESYWDDLRTPATMLKDSPTRPPVWTSYKGSYVPVFEDQAVNIQSVFWVWQIPHDYKLGTDLIAHIHDVPEDTESGVVYWDFTYSVAQIGDTFPSETTVSALQTMPEVADKHVYEDLATIPGSGITTLSTMILCSLTRRSDLEEDTFDAKFVYLLEVDLHYQRDSFGSYGEWDKL